MVHRALAQPRDARNRAFLTRHFESIRRLDILRMLYGLAFVPRRGREAKAAPFARKGRRANALPLNRERGLPENLTDAARRRIRPGADQQFSPTVKVRLTLVR